jgi:hypothetical protein
LISEEEKNNKNCETSNTCRLERNERKAIYRKIANKSIISATHSVCRFTIAAKSATANE